MVTSIASQCLQNTISKWAGSTCLIGRLRLLPNVVLMIMRAYALWCTRSGMNALVNILVLVHGGSKQKKNSTHRLNVEWQGTQNGSRVKLLGDLFCMAAWLQKKHGGHDMGTFIPEYPS